MRRRLLLGAAVTLPGCGFALKRAPELSFKTIQLTGFAPRSPLAAELKMNLEASPTTRVVESVGEAQVVLQALSEAREKVVVAQTSANQIREFELRLRFNFRVRSGTGKDLIPDSEILLRRSLTYTESAALAKEQEEAFLYRAMQSDIVSQVLRRLASIRLL
jgi:LPS-assembly lipoprotein